MFGMLAAGVSLSYIALIILPQIVTHTRKQIAACKTM